MSTAARSRGVIVATLALIVALTGALTVACTGGRDTVEKSTDVRGTAATSSAKNPDAYEYVARRGLGVVALAEARGLPADVATEAVDAIADALQTCAADQARLGKLVQGATRVVAEVNDDGTVGALNVKTSGGGDVAANAILCVIAPLRAHVFPPPRADAGRTPRGIAIEATWEGASGAPTKSP